MSATPTPRTTATEALPAAPALPGVEVEELDEADSDFAVLMFFSDARAEQRAAQPQKGTPRHESS